MKSTFSGLQFCLWQYGSISIRLAVVAFQMYEIARNSKKFRTYSSSRSSKVINLGTNRKLISNFLLVINSNFGRISHRFRDIAGRRGREVVGGQRWHHSKKRWWFPLWPLRYLYPFGRDLRSNVSDAQINRGGSFWAKISGCSPWSRPLMFGSADSEHPRLTNGVIISEEFQPMWSQSTNVTDGRTDRQTDRRHAIARPRFALKCIVR